MMSGLSYSQNNYITEEDIDATVNVLVESHGAGKRSQIERGVNQAARLWRENDGTAEQFTRFCRDNYIADPELRQRTADRFEEALANVYGHFREMGRSLSWHITVETGPTLPIDYMFARLSPGSHIGEDLFRTKIAFVALLNFPVYTLDELLESGPAMSRDNWAQARLVDGFISRIPPELSQKISLAYVGAGTYIDEYNIFMHHLLTPDDKRPFPEGLRLISHWNLRDELKALYAAPDGLMKQEMIYELMLKIIRQEVPEAIINNPAVDWKLSTNEVTVSPIIDGDIPKGWMAEGAPGKAVDNTPEPNTRYQHLLNLFKVLREVDQYYPTMPTLIDRRFQRDREMPEAQVEEILKSILGSPTITKVGRLIERRLGRKLRPYDIWYDGFKSRQSFSESYLDSIVREKYPSAEAFQADIPNILGMLGFDKETADYLGARIAVDPSRGIGHASGPGRRGDQARLRTRVTSTGMNYKGYNIAVHEFGHNVEQVFSLYKVDHTLLRGVPNTAFTECFAFMFQDRDLEFLGLTNDDPTAKHLLALDNLWGTYEIGGVSLLDMKVWNWMYDHPDANAGDLKEAVISLARNLWNEYFAPVFGVEDNEILAIYSHMIESSLYLPNYPLGQIIAFQIEQYLRTRDFPKEMERMCSIGSVTPDLWMKEAVGGPISTQPMIQAAEEALKVLDK
jgi:hypothetical protein